MVITENGVAILKSPPSWLVWFVFFLCHVWTMDFTCREDTLSRKPILLEVYSYILLDIWTSFCPGVSEPDVRNLVQLLILKSHFWCHCNNKDSRAERDRRKEVRRSRRKKK